jgi:hypothetical protein
MQTKIYRMSNLTEEVYMRSTFWRSCCCILHDRPVLAWIIQYRRAGWLWAVNYVKGVDPIALKVSVSWDPLSSPYMPIIGSWSHIHFTHNPSNIKFDTVTYLLWLYMGLELVIGLTERSQMVGTRYSSAVANSHTLQFATALPSLLSLPQVSLNFLI